jgi:polyphosphate kinase 2 (PPK2 family)
LEALEDRQRRLSQPSKRKDYLAAMEEMFQQTDTRWAPWKVIDGNNKKAARIAALTHIVETLEAVCADDTARP